MALEQNPLRGLRILVVEDNFLIAEVLRDLLEYNGGTVIGPVGTSAAALKLVRVETLDGALLDINLNGEQSFSIAAALAACGVPFMFLSGYGESSILPAEMRQVRRLAKPISDEQLIAAVRADFALRRTPDDGDLS